MVEREKCSKGPLGGIYGMHLDHQTSRMPQRFNAYLFYETFLKRFHHYPQFVLLIPAVGSSLSSGQWPTQKSNGFRKHFDIPHTRFILKTRLDVVQIELGCICSLITPRKEKAQSLMWFLFIFSVSPSLSFLLCTHTHTHTHTNTHTYMH